MIADNYKKYMHDLIDRILREVGPRPSCSPAERKAAKLLENEWQGVCDAVRVEPFTCNPHTFLGVLQVSAVMYLLSACLYWFCPIVSTLLMGAAAVMLYFEFIRYHEFADRLFPKGESANVVGIFKPRGELKKRVVVSGHIDSVYEFNLWLWLKQAAIPFSILAVLAMFLLLGISGARAVSVLWGLQDASVFTSLGFVSVALLPVVMAHLFFHTCRPVPGAMDDLAGVAVAAGLGKYLRDARDNDGFYPENTEVVIVGMGSEEAGLRGAKRYVENHRDEMMAIPTRGIFLDGIYDEKFLTVIYREL